MPSRLDALRALYDDSEQHARTLIPHAKFSQAAAAAYRALPALLAVCEAAQDYLSHDHHEMCAVMADWAPRDAACDCGRDALRAALAALTTEEG